MLARSYRGPGQTRREEQQWEEWEATPAHVDAAPDDVFAAVTDIAGIPEWNDRIQRVVMAPDALQADAEWLVELKILGQRFQSRRRVLDIDPVARRFRYRSKPEGDPDFAIWTWEIAPESGGSRVRVSWDLNPLQLANRLFWVRGRSRGLRKELPSSLAALEAFIKARSGAR